MALTLANDPVPLSSDRDGVVRVGGTRVTLATVVQAFRQGATAEEIAEQYPSLHLADIYSVLGYYLRHRSEIQAYLDASARRAETIRQATLQRHPQQGMRERLLARQAAHHD